MVPKPVHSSIGIGATPELSLRVSVAVLVRLILKDPVHGRALLALEQRVRRPPADAQARPESIAQPFGGAVRILDTGALGAISGNFHFDSESSRREQDFRIFIRPAAWSGLRQFCIHQFRGAAEPVIETDPARELAEELAEVVGINVSAGQYADTPLGIVIEDEPAPTGNIHAAGHSSVHLYRIFEAAILDPEMARVLAAASSGRPLEERRGSPPGNGILTIPLEALASAYLLLSPELLSDPIRFEGHLLDETVAAILDDVVVDKYMRA